MAIMYTGKAPITVTADKHTITVTVANMALKKFEEHAVTVWTAVGKDSKADAEKVALKEHKGGQVTAHTVEKRLLTMTWENFGKSATETDVPENRR